VKELLTRTIAGAVFAGIVVTLILSGSTGFLILLLAVQFQAIREFRKISNTPKGLPLILLHVSAAIVLIVLYMELEGWGDRNLLLILPVLFTLLFTSALFSRRPDTFKWLGNSLLGFIWITLPLAFFFALGKGACQQEYNPVCPLAVIVLIWVYDSFAYLTGKLFGKHKMFPALSPKKSWEGFAGGALMTALLSFLFGPRFIDLTSLQWAMTGLILSIAAMLGDLLESKFKREFQVKDSGQLIPGHGGILDRFDSLFFAVPVIYVLFELFRL